MTGVHSESAPALVLLNRQRSVVVNMAVLRNFAAAVLPACLLESEDGLHALSKIEEVGVTLVSDRRIDRIHQQFMNIPGATDVITFEHGEIVISAETAARCAAEFGHSLEAELGLYLIHGLLHLNGFLDGTESERRRMHAVQDRVWRTGLRVIG